MTDPKNPKNEKRDNDPNIPKERKDNDMHRNEEIHHAYEQKEKEKQNPNNGSW